MILTYRTHIGLFDPILRPLQLYSRRYNANMPNISVNLPPLCRAALTPPTGSLEEGPATQVAPYTLSAVLRRAAGAWLEEFAPSLWVLWRMERMPTELHLYPWGGFEPQLHAWMAARQGPFSRMHLNCAGVRRLVACDYGSDAGWLRLGYCRDQLATTAEAAAALEMAVY